jgi:hypothetical protein
MKSTFILAVLIAAVSLVGFAKLCSNTAPAKESASHTVSTDERQDLHEYATELVKVDEGQIHVSPKGYVFDAHAYLVKVRDPGDSEVEYIYGPDKREGTCNCSGEER